uniref:Secreted protein n=1 Tax=Paramormyrops kingsleyae TaxID=1676925 RepID=A0A3B3T8Z9_9TELE
MILFFLLPFSHLSTVWHCGKKLNSCCTGESAIFDGAIKRECLLMLIFVITNEMFYFNVVANQMCQAHLANQNASLSKSLVPAVQLAVSLGVHWQTSQYLLRYVHPLTFIFFVTRPKAP